MRLYHLTSRVAADSIRADGAIKATWPLTRQSEGWWRWKSVAWLTREPDPHRQFWKVHQVSEVRFALDLPDDDVHPWSVCKRDLPWNVRNGLERSARSWATVSGGVAHPEDWYVVGRPIPRSEWVEIVDLLTDQIVPF